MKASIDGHPFLRGDLLESVLYNKSSLISSLKQNGKLVNPAHQPRSHVHGWRVTWFRAAETYTLHSYTWKYSYRYLHPSPVTSNITTPQRPVEDGIACVQKESTHPSAKHVRPPQEWFRRALREDVEEKKQQPEKGLAGRKDWNSLSDGPDPSKQGANLRRVLHPDAPQWCTEEDGASLTQYTPGWRCFWWVFRFFFICSFVCLF